MFGYRTLGFGVNDPIAAAGGGIIESIQEIEITIASSSATGTTTISSVTTGNTAVFMSYGLFGGQRQSSSITNTDDYMCRVDLTDATTVTATRNTAVAFAITVACTVVEYKAAAVDSIQQGSINITGATATDTITSVTTSRSAVVYNGHSTDDISALAQDTLATISLTNATTVTATRSNSASVVDINYVVIEFAAGVTDSIQEFSILIDDGSSATGTATISSVTTARSALFAGGVHGTGSIEVNDGILHAQLTDATTVTATRASGSGDDPTILGTVVEFAAGNTTSVQRGTATVAGIATTEDVTVSAVVVANSVVTALSCTSTDANAIDPEEQTFTIAIVDTTTIRVTRNVTGRDIIFSWELLEYA